MARIITGGQRLKRATSFILWQKFLKVVFKPRRVLDVGCGMGFLVKWLRSLGVDAYGCDQSEFAISHINDEEYLTPNRIDIRDYVRVDRIEALSYEDDSFDLVTCLDVFEHLDLEQARMAIKELERVTSRHLFMIITVHHGKDKDELLPKGSLGDPTHRLIANERFWRNLFWKESGRNIMRRRDLERAASIYLGKILPWTFFIYEKRKK